MSTMFSRILPVALALGLASLTVLSAQTPAPSAASSRPVDLSHEKNLYVIGYAHLDTQWRWTYPLVIKDFVANTMRQNFPLIEKYPDYVFNFTGSRRYEFMKEYYPEDYERVKKYVAAGRWFPAGSSVDENDANVPSTESFVRQFLYGNHFFQREFGLQSDEFMLPDCFGFPASLPTLLTHAGIKGFSTQKLTWRSAVGIPFSIGRWVGPDGTSVVAALNALSYAGDIKNDLSSSEMWIKRIDETGGKSGVFADYHYYGTGDKGGAPNESSAVWLEKSIAGKGPVRVISSKADQMFHDITPEMAARLPEYKGELLLVEHSAGSLTSQAYMKRWNRKNEYLANAAESAATAASWLGAFPYPHEALYRAWELVLGSQMHDILPGTSLPKAYEYSWNDEVLALNQFAAITERSTAAILSKLDTEAKGVPVAVYNPLSFDREDPVEANVTFPNDAPATVTAFDPAGRPVPAQILERNENTLRILFLAKAPSVGYAVYDVRAGSDAAAKTDLKITSRSLENARYRVAINDDGDIASIFDKSLDRELLSAPVRLSIHTEKPEKYPAWNMDWADRQKPARAFVGGPAKITITESGPVRVALEVERTTENSTFVQQIRLAAGGASDRIEIADRIDWRTLEASLKADFPFAHANAEASYDDKVGVVRRGNNAEKHFEMPLQRWMDLTAADGSYGVSILNDSKYGSDKPDDCTLRLTLVYTPGVRDNYQDQGTQDLGRHDVLYALYAHRGDWVEGGTPAQAERLNQPLRAFLPEAHSGPLGRTFSFVSLNTAQVEISAVKQAEDSDEIVIRMRELTNRPATGVTMKFPAAITAAREVDAQERPIGAAKLDGGALSFDMKPFSLRAFAIKLAPAPEPCHPVASVPVQLTYDLDVASDNANRGDGAMDAAGGSYPAEMLPKKIVREGVEFELGPTGPGELNAVAAKGQKIALPAGEHNRLHLLVAAAGDTEGRMEIGGTAQPYAVPNWTGFIGQWDNRLWNQPIPELSYSVAQKMVGLVPGFIKRTPVAWFCTHHHTPAADAFYEFSYLFQLSYDLPSGAKSITLPNDPKLRLFAVSVSDEPSPAPAAAPLYDTLSDRQPTGKPSLPQAGKSFKEATEITILPPLYYRPGDLRYTLDGSEPTASSAVYEGPIYTMDSVKVAVRQIDGDGHLGPVVYGTIDVQDTTSPKLLAAEMGKNGDVLRLKFSKPLSPASASDLKNYTIAPQLGIRAASVSTGGRGITLELAKSAKKGVAYSIAVEGIRDASLRGNKVVPESRPFEVNNLAYSIDALETPKKSVTTSAKDLPLKKDDTWTMNIFIKPKSAPKDQTTIAGFGRHADKDADTGKGRYFAAFDEGLRFWAVNCDVTTNSPIEVGRWQMFTATYDGERVKVYKDGVPIGEREIVLSDDPDSMVNVGASDPWDQKNRFEGEVRAFTIRRGALTPDEVKELHGELVSTLD